MTLLRDSALTLQTETNPSIQTRRAVTLWLSKRNTFKTNIILRSSLQIGNRSIELLMSRKESSNCKWM
jgi:hypothetical protein